jgi:hypothetical protein
MTNQKLLANVLFEGCINPAHQPEEKGFKYNIWGGGYGRGSLSLLAGELLDLCNDPSSGYSQTPDGCFACPVSCRSRVKGPDITPGVAFCAQSYMYLESMVHQPEKGYSKVTWQAAKLGDLYVKQGKAAKAVEQYTETAEIFAKAGFHLKSIALFKQILKIQPKSVPALRRAAHAHEHGECHCQAY